MKVRKPIVVGETAWVPLTLGYFAVIDAADADIVGRFNWSAAFYYGGQTYAKRTEYIDGKKTTVKMHRFLLNTPAEMQTDHINGDGLDNSRANLRTATASQIGSNRGLQKNNTSGYKGVCWHVSKQKWQASITILGKLTFLGLHATPELAHAAYCAAAAKFYGEFANFGNLAASPQLLSV
jgi:hypothetical protein